MIVSKSEGFKNTIGDRNDLPTLQLAPSVWTDHLELKLEASVIPESLLQKVLRLYFEPKKTPFLALGEESEELGD